MKSFVSTRAAKIPKNVFLIMDRAKTNARDQNLEVIDLSIGSSDLAAPSEALQELSRAALDPTTLGYGLYQSSLPFRNAARAWMNSRFDLELSSQHLLSLIGSQEGLAHALLALTDPGDTILAPDPAYPSYFGAFALADVQPFYMRLEAQNSFLPDFSSVPANAAKAAKVMILNYPNNPTAGVASLGFWQQALEFCRDYDLALIHDAPYTEMTFDGYIAPSALQADLKFERTIELHSLSKTYHMAGLRMAWAAGNLEMLNALASTKGVIDFNQYLGIQRAAIVALESDPAKVRADANIFQARRDVVLTGLRKLGWVAPIPQASMYVWAKLPDHTDSFGFCERLCLQTGVALAPGKAFGESGEGWVRFALVQPSAKLEEALSRIADFVGQPDYFVG
jgi:aspartate/methionine/tyrosine aminotransferase